MAFGMLFFISAILALGLILLVCAAIALAIGLGGMSLAMFVKNEDAKKILFFIFMIIICIGFLCFSPFAMSLLSLSAGLMACWVAAFSIAIIVLALFGIKHTRAFPSKALRVILAVLFGIFIFGAASMVMFTLLVTLLVAA